MVSFVISIIAFIIILSVNLAINHPTDFLVVVRFPLMMRVDVETDLKFPVPPPIPLSIPPMEEEEEEENVVKSTEMEKRKQERGYV